MRTKIRMALLTALLSAGSLPVHALTLPPSPPIALDVGTVLDGSFILNDFNTVPNFTNGDVAVDIYRYDLGTTLDGTYSFNFNTLPNPNTTATLYYYIMTDANEARFSDPNGLLVGVIAEGVWYDPNYFAPHEGSQNTLTFNALAGTNYFAWVWAETGPGQGGVGTLNYQVSISPVPIPAALPLALSAFTALGWLTRRRRR